jgi:hypothetical protein
VNTTLDYRNTFLCICSDDGVQQKRWFPVIKAEHSEVRSLLGRPVLQIDQQRGSYVDEEGNVFQLLNKGETEPIEVEQLGATENSELEVLLEASLKERKTRKLNGDSKRMRPKNRNNGRKQRALQVAISAPESSGPETKPGAQSSRRTEDGAPSEAPVLLNLRQKLAEVRRRIGYVQKRGHNERFNYSYVTAADIAGSVGDLLAELGVVVIPKLEEISYESAAVNRGDAIRMARVVMAYTFADVDSGEEIIAKVAGQGLDPGDKAPYKAMTGALKYALLQSFLLATGDDPEDERGDARFTTAGSDRPINAEEIRELEKRIEETGTELERVLAYYKVAALSEMTESAYRRALEVLNRKLAKQGNQETVHAQD